MSLPTDRLPSLEGEKGRIPSVEGPAPLIGRLASLEGAPLRGDPSVPQLVLTSGQMAPGIQGAQLIIPTAQGVTVQPIIAIPAALVAGGLAQLCLSAGHVLAATPANLQALAASAGMEPAPLSRSEPQPPAHITRSGRPRSSPAAVDSRSVHIGGDLALTGRAAPHPTSPAGVHSPESLTEDDNEPTVRQATGADVDGVDLQQVKEFARVFKMRRLSLGLTQTQVGQALSVSMGPAYSQSAICRFENLDITPKSAQKIKPILEKWLQEAEAMYRQKMCVQKMGNITGIPPLKKRKRRTSFTPQALEALNAHFARNTHPTGHEITHLASRLGYEREVVRIWFCNKRQALKSTVRLVTGRTGRGSPPGAGREEPRRPLTEPGQPRSPDS
ncbi:POU domain, class 6, transcription factor 1-like [Amphibalanus amphitrite]|uniref:POU domain, class 6, transcription factor 1-like n=1 Tax=Amphibalanus amphitrite TaxID=1232801 RepID=UPI001C91CC73|nr:POU domain, class 6, transcription factor 1-like [Amphibalanus amphitrite]